MSNQKKNEFDNDLPALKQINAILAAHPELSWDEAIRKFAASKKPLDIQLGNDYAFRKVFQDEIVLAGFLTSILGFKDKDVAGLKVINPHQLGNNYHEKENVLDVKVLLSSGTRVNLELQILRQNDWNDRSVFYICRAAVEGYPRGSLDYDFPACVHLGILDFDLTEHPDYFHEYVIQHKKYHDIYTSKIRFFVLELKKLKNASRIERKSKRYRWAALIAATTWEDVEKLTKGDPYMERARDLIYDMSQNEEERYFYLRQQMAIIDENSRLRTARNDGLEEGLATGRAEGRKEGLAAGRKEGREEGRKAGNIEGRILERCRDVQDGDYTKKHAASKLGISLADFEQYYEEFLQTGAITL
jgi:predicted transposase/invertase (TIGR01784 family)